MPVWNALIKPFPFDGGRVWDGGVSVLLKGWRRRAPAPNRAPHPIICANTPNPALRPSSYRIHTSRKACRIRRLMAFLPPLRGKVAREAGRMGGVNAEVIP